MPKAIAFDDDSYGSSMREGLLSGVRARLFSRPKDTFAALIATAGIVAIIVNAMFLQSGRHPSPLFGAKAVPLPQAAVAAQQPMPRARPAEADVRPAEPAPRVAAPKANVAAAPAAGKVDPLGDLIVSTRRMTAVQRALTEFGYGQIKPSGSMNAETRTAIERFERERKLPVTGQVSDRLVRELSGTTGRAID